MCKIFYYVRILGGDLHMKTEGYAQLVCTIIRCKETSLEGNKDVCRPSVHSQVIPESKVHEKYGYVLEENSIIPKVVIAHCHLRYK